MYVKSKQINNKVKKNHMAQIIIQMWNPSSQNQLVLIEMILYKNIVVFCVNTDHLRMKNISF